MKWEIGKRKGTRVVRREGKGRGRVADEQRTWEEWLAAKEKSWRDEEWRSLSSDDLSMGDTGREAGTVGGSERSDGEGKGHEDGGTIGGGIGR